MSTRRINKKSLRQQGGEENSPENAVMQITQQVSELLNSGADPKAVIQQLSESGLSSEQIMIILQNLGLSEEDIQGLFQTDQAPQEEQVISQDQFNEELPMEQFGGNIAFQNTLNRFFSEMGDDYSRDPSANYLPMNLNTKGTPLGALSLAVEAGMDLFGGNKDPKTGLKQGFFRDVKVKKDLANQKTPYYYNYNINKDPNDKNLYNEDPASLYKAYKTNKPLGLKDQPKTETLSIDNVSKEADISSMSFKDWYISDPLRRNSGDIFNNYEEELSSNVSFFDKGGENNLPKAQFSLPDWLDTYSTPIDQLEYPLAANEYFKSLTRTNYAEDKKATEESGVQQLKPIANQNQLTTFTGPQVEITNKYQGDLNRFIDSRFVQGYEKLSNFGVKGANFLNEIFKEKKRAEAEDNLYRMTMADKAYGYYENPANKRGTWDVNTGLAEQNNYGSYMQEGGEMELELDDETIQELIAAGADIEII